MFDNVGSWGQTRHQDPERDIFTFHCVFLNCLNFFSPLVQDVQYMFIYFLLVLLLIKIQPPLQGVPLIDRGMNLETET